MSSVELKNDEWLGLVVHVFCGAQEWGMVWTGGTCVLWSTGVSNGLYWVVHEFCGAQVHELLMVCTGWYSTCVLWSTGMMNGLDWRYMCFVEHRNEEWLGLGGTWVLPSAWIMNGLDCVLHEFCRVHECGMVWTVCYTSSAECTNEKLFGLCATRVLPSARMRNGLDWWYMCSVEHRNEEWFWGARINYIF